MSYVRKRVTVYYGLVFTRVILRILLVTAIKMRFLPLIRIKLFPGGLNSAGTL